jgi:selenocysteine lyase/cysteine desulfurase
MIYLDNAATSFPKPEPVYQALDRFARTSLANPGRAGHRMAIAAERTLDAARHALNQFFRGEAPERWIFTLNCTDGLNLAIKGIIQAGERGLSRLAIMSSRPTWNTTRSAGLCRHSKKRA